MKRILLFLTCLIGFCILSFAQSKSYDWTGQNGVTASTITDDPITITFSKNSGTTAPTYYNDGLRLYYQSNSTNGNGSGFTVTCLPGYKLTEISFTMVNSYGWGNNPCDKGSISNNVWTPGNETITSVSFKNTKTSNSNVRVASLRVSYTSAEGPSSLTDEIDVNFTGVTANTTYTDWYDKISKSGALYSGNSAKNNTALQLRGSQNSGIISTTSGGKIKEVKITWATTPTNSSGKSISVYGKDSPYESTSDLYDNSKAGKKLGDITYNTSNTSATLTVPENEIYQYIGLKVATSNTMYINKIEILWEQGASEEPGTKKEYTGLNQYDNTEDITFDVNASYQLQLGDSHPTIKYDYDPSGVISIDKDGKITATETGEVFVTATWDEDSNWLASSTDGINFLVTVTKNSTGGGTEIPTPEGGDGTENNPYTIAELAKASPSEEVWVKGYILGSMVNNKPEYGSSSSHVATNLVLGAENNTDADYIPVELPSGSIRTELNVKDHSENIGKLVKIKGLKQTYFSKENAIKGTKAYAFIEENPNIGEIILTVNSGEVIDEDDFLTVTIGSTLTFEAKNADNITVTIQGLEDSDEQPVQGEYANGKYIWTPNKLYSEEAYTTVTATPYLKGKSGEPLEFILIVNDIKLPMPIVKIGELELEDGDEKVVAAGTELNISCEGAKSIFISFNDDDIELKEAPFKFTIEEGGDLLLTGATEFGTQGDTFVYTFTIGEVDENMPAVGSTFRQVLKDNKDIDLEEGGYYAIARHYVSETNPVAAAMSIEQDANNITPTTDPKFVSYSQKYYDEKASEVKTRSDFSILTSSDDMLIFKLEKQNGEWGLKTVNLGDGLVSSQKYIGTTETDNTDLVFNPEFTPAYIDFTNQNNVKINFKKEDGRLVTFAGTNSNYFNYGKTTTANVQLYKYTTAKEYTPNFENLKIKAGDTYTLTLDGDHPEITYKVKGNTSCITISDNEITAKKIKSADKATVMAEWKDSEEWLGNLVEFEVVVRYPAELSFRYDNVRGKIGVGVNAQAVNYTGDGTVTYSVWEYKDEANGDYTLVPTPDIFINETTGMIRPEDITKAIVDKIYTVVAHVEGDEGSYVEDDASYTIVFEAPETGSLAPAGEATFDFTDTTNPYNFYTFTTNNTDGNARYAAYYENTINDFKGNMVEGDMDPWTHVSVNDISEEGVKLSLNGSFRWFNSNELRAYGPGASITLTAGKGKIISVAFKSNVDKFFTSNFEIEGDGKGSYDSTSELYIWTSNSEDGVDYVKFTAKNSPKIYMINVSSTQPQVTDKPEIGLSFTNSGEGEERYFNLYAGEDTKLPFVLEHNKDAIFAEDIILDIDEMDEEDDAETYQGYTITGTDWNDISVNITYPGVYTFRAEYNAEKLVNEGKLDKVENAKFLNGMAILRLNVFPRLNVLPSDEHDSALADDERTDAPELTLVQPVINDEGQQEAMITLPSLAQLGDDYKYSTVNISLEIKRGTDAPETYKFINGKYYKDGEVDTKPLDEAIKFTEDGYVKYILKYADTEDFQIASTVHVILMPQTMVDRSEDYITLAPSKNATLKYALVYGNGKNDVKRRATEIPDDDWEPVTEDFKTFNAEELKDVTAIFYKSVKDLNDNEAMVEDNAVPANSILSDDGVIVLAVTNVTLNMGEGQSVPFKTDDHNYSLENIFSFKSDTNTNINMEEGTDFIVTVKALKDADGWETTTATTEDALNEAYNQVFATMQKGDGLYNQYISLETDYVDGFFTSITNVNVTKGEGDNAGSFSVSADLPCSGVYEVTVSPIDGSEYTFDEEKVQLTVTPNLYGTFGTDNGFNIEGYSFEYDETAQKYYISFPKTVGEGESTIHYEFTNKMVCYMPGTYFASSFTADSDVKGSNGASLVKRAANEPYAYFATVDLTGMNGEDAPTEGEVNVTVSKNGAEGTFTFYVRKTDSGWNTSTGVEEIEGAEEGEAIYFTIDGVRVQNPEKGIYIKVVGNKATKVLL